ncbi:MAG TPA: HD domain-containing protein [Terriglobales bacterium]|nr:HD domain-containing protein [Terriglobales bacterium]
MSQAPPLLSRRFQDAFLLAAEKHSSQTRKQTRIPYIAHLMSVAALVLEAGGDEDLAIAALLHDVVEDCGGEPMLEEVRRRFGDRVAHIVDGCTDAYTVPKPPWRQRKEEYLQHLKDADGDVRLVSAADKLHNAREILKDVRELGEPVWDRFKGKREGTLWYYRALADELIRENNWIVRQLQSVVSELEQLARSHERSGKGRD